MRQRVASFWKHYGDALFDAAWLVAALAFIVGHLASEFLLADTTLVGGDTPAHNYLASHLQAQFFGHGRVVSWAGGWWCGFPMFQFYFCLPYLVTALLSGLLPFNIALKLVSVAGMLALPFCAYAGARILRLPRPVPLLSALAMVPFLFVHTHTMWGVNVYSTLAGMIANSWSFAILVVAVACAWRDCDDGRFRPRTVLLLVALTASHFFTVIMAGLAMAAIPLLWPACGFRRAVRILAAEGALAALLMAWWLVPLFAKQAYAVDFGTNWDVTLTSAFPIYAIALLPLVAGTAAVGLAKRSGPVLLLCWMLASAAVLFVFGARVSPVFVNVRLWPFVFYAWLALAAVGTGYLLRPLRANKLLISALALLVLAGVVRTSADARAWARWNYAGLELKPHWPEFEQILRAVKGTPGRLANDLSDGNNVLGSNRIFESVPHLVGKPILEGGIVNSAIGALSAYYVQGESSENCAGFPTMVKPPAYNITNATAHLRLFNVKHFVARWPRLQQDLRGMPEWRLLRRAGDWELFELTTHGGEYVYVPENYPIGVPTTRWKEYSLEWLYTFAAMDQPFAFLPPDEAAARAFPGPVIGEAQFRQFLTSRRVHDGEIQEWLSLGPFPYPADAADPLAVAPVDEHGLDPVEGQKTGGRAWRLLFGQGPLLLHETIGEHQLIYSGVNLFAPEARDAVLHYSHDDDARIWLNGKEVACSTITGLDEERSVPVRLEKGRNRLLHKLAQRVGGQFFRVRITDPAGNPFPDVVASVEPQAPEPIGMLLRPTGAASVHIREEQVDDNAIRFRTDAVGRPHIIKCTYYPNWLMRQGTAYMVTPSFLLVYPQAEQVELRYGRVGSDWLGLALSALGLLILAPVVAAERRRYGGRRARSGRVRLLKFLDGTAGLALCWVLGYARHALVRKPHITSGFQGKAVSRLLVIRPGGMGDMVVLLPVLQRLESEFPGATIDLVCEQRNLGVLRLAGREQHALAYDAAPFRLLRHLLTHRYDAAIDTEQFHHFSAIMALLSRAPIRIGFKINPSRNLLYTHLINYALDGYEGRQFMRLLQPLGVVRAEYELEGVLARVASAVELPSGALRDELARLSAGGAPVAVHIGSTTFYKQWGVSKFIRLVQTLTAGEGLGVVLVGGAEDAEAAAQILRYVDTSAGRVVSCAGRLRLGETARVIRMARLFVGGDSGLAHLAVAVGTPTVALFGPSDHLKWGLENGRHIVVRKDLACSPCFIFGYHRLCHTVDCMAEIAVEDVLNACRRLLAQPAG